ncbi:MAG: DUF192 domain-containing protein [Alteraurantiacibacter sp.]
MTTTIRFGGLVFALVLAGCGSEASEPAPAPAPTEDAVADANVHPTSGLQLIDVTVMTDEGSHTFRTEVADTPAAQGRGMMFRANMGENEAMLFPYDVPGDKGFWMKNTSVPLDIIFIAEDRTIINIGAGEPFNETSVRSEAPAIAVLEIPQGRSEQLGIEPGDSVDW